MTPLRALPHLALVVLSLGFATGARSADVAAPEPEVLLLWPEGVPDLRADAAPERVDQARVSAVHFPTLTVHRPRPEHAVGTAVVVCPGGGYGRLAIDHEGTAVARWLADRGVVAFVLRYRLSEYGHPAPLRDVSRAIRTVRRDAKRFGVAPDRIGVVGFSAGGHLAGSAATLFAHADGRTGAPLDEIDARPDFAALIYPVVTMDPAFTHAGSRRNLLGGDPAEDLERLLSLEEQVTNDTPPMFLVHSGDDKAVPLENTLRLIAALRAHGVSFEAHLHETGGHGFGMRPSANTVADWPARFEAWLRFHGWLQARD
ncbi:alpha/beta hydrolase [Opitutales bacterium ASA1]|uniref:alpha/beta hydrolase n=1 Tax=Congregicoccus parvus TaxID=3081749 RepID=UPI002B2E25AC|nr:alpha/beta hydrolase [Opitutales bacterium ASA1]